MAQESWKKETDATECQTPEGPILCANNCGFFGSASTNNLCSKCYRDIFKKQQQQQLKASPAIPIAEKMPSSTSLELEPIVGKVDKVIENRDLSSEGGPSSVVVEKQLPNRCMACRKRVGLTGFKCRCGGTFCSVHRYSEKHECSFDYKSAGRDAIAKENPVVKAERIERI